MTLILFLKEESRAQIYSSCSSAILGTFFLSWIVIDLLFFSKDVWFVFGELIKTLVSNN